MMGRGFGCYRCMVFFFFWVFFIGYSVFSVEAQNITRNHSIRDGETIVSPGEKFVFGFFSPRNSDFRYVGIWYNKVKIQSIVWVANRDRPISGNGGAVAIGEDGNLIITERNGAMIWSSNVTVPAGSNSTAHLLDTGNLVLTAPTENSKRPLWQSFNHPTDTYLPDMEVHMNRDEGEKHVFTSWKSATDPSPGNYSLGVDPRGSPQIVIWEGGNRHWRSGHWNGLSFIGVPEVRSVFLFGFKLTNQGNGRLYFTYTPMDSSDLIKFQINWEGIERQERWNNESNVWSLIQQHPLDECDRYNHCGAFAKCMDKQRCSCIEGFVAKDSSQWGQGNWSGGCTRRMELQRCVEGSGLSVADGKTDGFVEVQNVKLPDYLDYVGNQDIEECRKMCLQNCSCTAYAVVSAINCMIWNRDLVDVRQFEQGGNALYIRVAHTELGDKNHVIKPVVITTVIIGTFLICLSIWLLWQRKRKSRVNLERISTIKSGPSREFSRNLSEVSEGLGQQPNGTELAIFSFSSLVAATDNFADANKLGQGGFGHVYKGVLPDGQEIAVKRLSRKSGQGLQEFTNEIMLIAKLQHRNLVRLLGGCIQGEEKILLYEYMPNKSLDSYLFDPDKKALLDWSTRFNIIEGIARGLLYLHRDSRLRIIHRDLKASNILLDEEMNPKISDFGMARIFGGNQNEANTNIVVGTYGYMAPEYAMEGLFSLKSDVYSFGVLLLEIVTGRRNTSFRSTDYSNLIAYAWDLWDRGRAIEIVDPWVLESCNREVQVLRCIHVGMLCVQDMAGHRPSMPSVVLMLESENATLPRPSQPTFTSMRHNLDDDRLSAHQDVISSNNLTITAILGR